MQKVSIIVFTITVLFSFQSLADASKSASDGDLPLIAPPVTEAQVPQPLRPWIPWVLENVTSYGCTTLEHDFVCTWPSELLLLLNDAGGIFELSVTMDRDQYILLPGSRSHWPARVKDNERPIPILDYNGAPMVALNAGPHQLRGEFQWTQLPEGLSIPAEYAVITLAVNDTPVPFVQRDRDGRIWLKKTTLQPNAEERLSLEVFRKISDGVPMTVTTHILVRSTGKSTEVTLENALLKNTVPLAVRAELPVRLLPEGHLKMQTRGGTWNVEIDAVVNHTTDQFTALPHKAPWPDTEIWTFEPNEQIRQTEIRGLTGIDPGRTNLKDEWKSLAAYGVSNGNVMNIHTTRRGETNPPPDRITLNRHIWLDMNGSGCTISDRLSGSISRTTRLDLKQDATLGRVQINGADQVITANPKNQKAGVELRDSQLSMVAESRMNTAPSTLSAVGWSTDVQQLSAELNLPPGWNLITATGVDSVPGTWWDAWTLFAFFFVLLASIATGRLTRWYYGILALITLVLLHNEAPVEFLAFVGFPLLIGLALIQALPKSRLRIGIIIGWSFFALILIASAIPFSVDQVRQGLYPQLQNEYYVPDYSSRSDKTVVKEEDVVSEWGAAEPEKEMLQQELDRLGYKGGDAQEDMAVAQHALQQAAPLRQERKSSRSSSYAIRGPVDNIPPTSGKQQQKALQQDPEAVVQTGPGVPDWQWHTFTLDWQGPVSKDHHIRLYITGPTTHLILAILRVILLALFAGVLLIHTFRSIQQPPSKGPSIRLPGKKSGAATAGAAVMFAIIALAASPGRAEMPDSGQLSELRQRLTRSPSCAPHCADTASVRMRVMNGTVNLTAAVHTGAQTAWPLPGPASNWVPAQITVDGEPATALRLQPDGFIYVKLQRGIHTVELQGKMKNENAFTIEFKDIPHSGAVDADGYAVEGLRADGRFETSVAISKKLETAQATVAEEGADASYTPWLKVVRSFDFGIPWLIHTTVTRVSPTGTPLMFRIPLVQGESITASELEVSGGSVNVPFGRDETRVEWSSILKETPRVTLRAPKNKNWTETWHVRCGPIWQCDLKGTPPLENSVAHKMYQPWPGEKLVIKTTHPKAVKGQTVTIDRARLNVSPGLRLTESTLAMTVRSSQGGVQQLTLPKGATIQRLTVDGARRPFKQKQNHVEITLHPGEQHLEMTWQQQGGIGTVFKPPRIKVGAAVANFHLTVKMPSNRWLVGVSGPSWGPAILFWGYLLTILILSFFVLGRTKMSFLKGWQWALLSLGLTQVSIAVALIIVSWFFVLQWRSRDPLKKQMNLWHNLLQVGVGIWTFVALICLLTAVYTGLAVQPDMQVSGLGSSNSVLKWYTDHMVDASPEAVIWSVPLIIWKGLMLAWALWLSYSLIGWAKWSFQAFNTGGIWRPFVPGKPDAPDDSASKDPPTQESRENEETQ